MPAGGSDACGALGSPTSPLRDRAVVRVHACNWLNQCAEPISGLTAELCAKLDPNCKEPIDRPMELNGDFVFEVPTGGTRGLGFEGFLKITTPRAFCGDKVIFGSSVEQACGLVSGCTSATMTERCKIPVYPDALVFFNPPVKSDVLNAVTVPMIPMAITFSILAAADTQTADPSAGFVFATVLDCTGTPTSGATVELMPKPPGALSTLYLSNGLPNAAATMTDASGLGGVRGVSAGYHSVIARRGNEVGTVGIQVWPQAFTYVNIILSGTAEPGVTGS